MKRDAILGIDLGGTKMLMLCGQAQRRIETGTGFTPELLEDHVRGFLQEQHLQPQGIGIAIPGLVDGDGVIQACDVLPRMAGWNPVDAFSDFGCKVAAINDVKAALVEELHDAQPGLTAGVIMVGTAVGAAFQVAGEPLLGANGWAGELGYMPIQTGQGIKRLDELAGGSFIAAKLKSDGRGLAELAGDGDEPALDAIRDGGAALGLALATVINLLNPSGLVLGGGTLGLPGYLEAAKQTARDHSLPELWQLCTISTVRAGEAVAAMGAARVAAGHGG